MLTMHSHKLRHAGAQPPGGTPTSLEARPMGHGLPPPGGTGKPDKAVSARHHMPVTLLALASSAPGAPTPVGAVLATGLRLPVHLRVDAAAAAAAAPPGATFDQDKLQYTRNVHDFATRKKRIPIHVRSGTAKIHNYILRRCYAHGVCGNIKPSLTLRVKAQSCLEPLRWAQHLITRS